MVSFTSCKLRIYAKAILVLEIRVLTHLQHVYWRLFPSALAISNHLSLKSLVRV